MKKLLNVIGLIADLLPGAAMAAAGIALIIGAQTGVIWS